MAAAPQAVMLANVTPAVSSAAPSVDAEEEIKVIIERNVPVPMRDGTILRADIHRPDRGGPYPVLVQGTPYGKDGDFTRFVKAGYIVVSQDARGRYESDGTWKSDYRLQTHEPEDGYDTIEWAAKLSGSTGKVGTFGISYLARFQWQLAPLRPSSLVAMSAWSIPARMQDESPSTIRPGFRLSWLDTLATDMRRKANLPGVHTAWEAKILWNDGGSHKWLNWIPWLELPYDFFSYETDALKDWLRKPNVDFWKLHERCKDIIVPNLEVVGWYDHCNGDMLLFRTMVEEAKTEVARKASRIIIGPWDHANLGRRRSGRIDFGPDAELDTHQLQINWFDYWLKGISNGVDKGPPVRIFVMGDNQWRDEQHWPLQRTKDKVFYITSDGHANTPSGGGKLVEKEPVSSENDGYTYDPNDPVPTPYGAQRPQAVDLRQLASRQDILVYQTEPLTDRVEVTGNPMVELYAASSAPDTDWFVRLIDVYPDGLALDVAQGFVCARYRSGLDKPRFIEPGEVVKYTIRMRPTSNAFLPGHRIRLDITSSDFPNYDRNHNTALDQNTDTTLVIANQVIYHGGEQATRIILPWVLNPIEEEKPAEEENGEPDQEKQTYPLHQAAAKGDIEQLKLLMSKGADVNAKDETGDTALCYAVKVGKKGMVQMLVEGGADVNIGSSPPLSIAVDKDDIAVAEYLIAHGANVNAPAGWTALQEAPYASSLEMVALLIAKGADVNAGPWTALHSAVEEGRRDIAELLIAKGADVNAETGGGTTPLSYAFSRGNHDMAKVLLIAGGAFISEEENTLRGLHYTAILGYQDLAGMLLAEGAKVDERDDNYQFTALHYAARFGNKNVAEVLIANGADIKAKDKWDYQPMHWAAYHDRPEIIELLIAKGADVNAKTSLGQTPLELATPRRNTAAIEVLRKHGAKE